MKHAQKTHPVADTAGLNDPGPGRRMALDVGSARIGVAVSDSAANLATPVETVARATRLNDTYDGADIERILDLIEDYRPVELVIGLPKDLHNRGSRSISHARFIGDRVQARLNELELGVPCPIRYADERLTTVVATQQLRASGVNAKKGRAIIDQAAAVEILQNWLDARKVVLA